MRMQPQALCAQNINNMGQNAEPTMWPQKSSID